MLLPSLQNEKLVATCQRLRTDASGRDDDALAGLRGCGPLDPERLGADSPGHHAALCGRRVCRYPRPSRGWAAHAAHAAWRYSSFTALADGRRSSARQPREQKRNSLSKSAMTVKNRKALIMSTQDMSDKYQLCSSGNKEARLNYEVLKNDINIRKLTKLQI